MEKIDSAIYLALRDDSEATVGIRALLGNTTTTPYNVYHAFFPDNFDFSPASGNKGIVVYNFVSGTPDKTVHSKSTIISEDLYDITAYHRSLDTLEDIHRRIKKRLYLLNNVTKPTSQAELHQLLLDSERPPTFDDDWQVWFQTKSYRAWVRDDDIIS